MYVPGWIPAAILVFHIDRGPGVWGIWGCSMWQVFFSTDLDVALFACDYLCLRPTQPHAYLIEKITIEAYGKHNNINDWWDYSYQIHSSDSNLYWWGLCIWEKKYSVKKWHCTVIVSLYPWVSYCTCRHGCKWWTGKLSWIMNPTSIAVTCQMENLFINRSRSVVFTSQC